MCGTRRRRAWEEAGKTTETAGGQRRPLSRFGALPVFGRRGEKDARDGGPTKAPQVVIQGAAGLLATHKRRPRRRANKGSPSGDARCRKSFGDAQKKPETADQQRLPKG